MAILKSFRAPNGVPVSYHRVGRVEGKVPDLTVHVQSWVDEETYAAGFPAAFTHYVPFDASALVTQMELAALTLQDLEGGERTDP